MDYLCRLHLVAGFQAEGRDCNPHSDDHHRCDLTSAPCGPAVRCSLGHFLGLCKQSSFRSACSQVDGHQSWRFGVLIGKGEALLGLFIVVNRQDRVLCPVLPGYSTQQATQETPKRHSLHQPPYSVCFPMVCDTESVTNSVPNCDSSQSGPLNAGHHAGSTFSELSLAISESSHKEEEVLTQTPWEKEIKSRHRSAGPTITQLVNWKAGIPTQIRLSWDRSGSLFDS